MHRCCVASMRLPVAVSPLHYSRDPTNNTRSPLYRRPLSEAYCRLAQQPPALLSRSSCSRHLCLAGAASAAPASGGADAAAAPAGDAAANPLAAMMAAMAGGGGGASPFGAMGGGASPFGGMGMPGMGMGGAGMGEWRGNACLSGCRAAGLAGRRAVVQRERARNSSVGSCPCGRLSLEDAAVCAHVCSGCTACSCGLSATLLHVLASGSP